MLNVITQKHHDELFFMLKIALKRKREVAILVLCVPFISGFVVYMMSIKKNFHRTKLTCYWKLFRITLPTKKFKQYIRLKISYRRINVMN